MSRLLTAAILGAIAATAVAQEERAGEPRLQQLETLVVTAAKQEPAEEETAAPRLRAIETMTITAAKEQPADHQIDDDIAALLAEIAKVER